MEPQIRYARTDDGVSIAYTTTGDGPPVLHCPAFFISMQHLMSDAAPAGLIGPEVAPRTRFTRFDPPGMGASQREVADFSIDAQVRAIEAVAGRLPDDPFTLVSSGGSAASAALYATRHPDRVRAFACVSTWSSLLADQRFVSVISDDWSLVRRRIAGAVFPEGPVSSQRWFSNAIRESGSAEVAAGYMQEFARTDLKEIYGRIRVPTLLFVAPTGSGRESQLTLASVVPDCHVVSASGGSDAASAILAFMGVDTVRGHHAPGGEALGTAIILFADIVDSTAMTERMGDAAFRERARSLDERLRAAISGAGGSAIDGKLLGDGVLAVFPAASQAIDAALGCVRACDGTELELHLGIHAGDVIRERDPGGQSNVYGGAVNIASRISALSAPGEVLVSRTVRDLARTSAGVVFEDRGEHALKGIGEAVRVYVVRKAEAG